MNGIDRICFCISFLDNFNFGELGQCIFVALGAVSMQVDARFGQDRYLALAAQGFGQFRTAQDTRAVVAGANKGDTFGLFNISVYSHNRNSAINRFIDDRHQAVLGAEGNDAGWLLGDSLFECRDHGVDVIIGRADILGFDAHQLACFFKSDLMIIEVLQVAKAIDTNIQFI